MLTHESERLIRRNAKKKTKNRDHLSPDRTQSGDRDPKSPWRFKFMPKDWIDLILELTGKPGIDKSYLPNLKQNRLTGETRISYGEAESLEKITSPPRTEERSAS
jgi:hypothetical protein